MALLEARNIQHRYIGIGDAEDPYVLKGVELAVDSGETTSIVGPSGSGKSTLLNILGALDVPNRGDILLEGENLTLMDEKQRAKIRNTKIGFVFQEHHLLPQCSVLENVLVPTLAGFTTEPHSDCALRARGLIERVGLAERVDHRPGELSGGERQRVAVVRALINQPPLVLADEPTGSLDREGSEKLVSLLLDLNESLGTTFVLVTHSSDVAERMGRTLTLRDGILN